jgi:hypothetical protein
MAPHPLLVLTCLAMFMSTIYVIKRTPEPELNPTTAAQFTLRCEWEITCLGRIANMLLA